MAPQFCGDCGTILDLSADDNIVCDICGRTNKSANIGQVTVSTSDKFPSKLRDKLASNTQEVDADDMQNPMIRVDCENCDAKEVSWSQAQLRSADEGTTIFYHCLKCGHRWSQNN